MTSTDTTIGKLYLVPAPLDFGCKQDIDLREVMPLGTLEVASSITHWICENAKTTRAYLKRIDAHSSLTTPIQAQAITELPREIHKKGDHQGGFDAKPLLTAALQGHNMGLVSEAGMPAVADPGSSVVRAAHELGIRVVPLVGPVSLLLALAASGLNGQNFAFVGYLPQDGTARTQRLRELENLATKHGQTQMFIETPYRNQALWDALVNGLQGNTRLARASGLTMASMQVHCKTVQAWRSAGKAQISGEPTVFLIGK